MTVEAVAVVQTDASNIAETKGSLRVNRSSGGYRYALLRFHQRLLHIGRQPGVQIDLQQQHRGRWSRAFAAFLQYRRHQFRRTGIAGRASEMFPSFNSIEEIKISENLNPAEFGGVADVTTVSKSGTNEFHGGAFENVQNTDFNAADTFANQVTEDKMNNFGIYLGGPVIFPKLYNGRNKTFFFGSFEVLRLPKSETFVNSVPTAGHAQWRSVRISERRPTAATANQLTGYPNNQIPASQLNPYTQKLAELPLSVAQLRTSRRDREQLSRHIPDSHQQRPGRRAHGSEPGPQAL